jgi:hypothetical protein
MTLGREALGFALDLARMPTLVEVMRSQPLPEDTIVVIRIAAGCADTTKDAEVVTGLKSSILREACAFYLQQVLFTPEADGFRVLGVQPGASRREMREHMRWLVTWLHPDGNRDDWESVFVERVLHAWREAGAKASQVSQSGRGGAGVDRTALKAEFPRPVQRWVALPLTSSEPTSGLSRRTVTRLLVGLLALSGVLLILGLPY